MVPDDHSGVITETSTGYQEEEINWIGVVSQSTSEGGGPLFEDPTKGPWTRERKGGCTEYEYETEPGETTEEDGWRTRRKEKKGVREGTVRVIHGFEIWGKYAVSVGFSFI